MIIDERDNALEDLFRNKLEEPEVIPGDDLTRHFMRRLERKEFLRFNPSRFNVFYFTALAAAGATVAGMLLFSPPKNTLHQPEAYDSVTLSEMTIIPETMTGDKPADLSGSVGPDRKGAGPIIISNEPAPGREVVTERQTVISTTSHDTAEEAVLISKNEIASTATGLLRAAIETSTVAGCVPLSVNFRSIASGSFMTVWSFGDGGSSDEQEINYIYDIPGTYNVVLTVFDDKGHKAVSSSRIEVWPRPRASFEIHQPDGYLTENSIRFVNLSTGATQYLWDFGDGVSSGAFEATHRYEAYGRFDVMLVAFSEYGCADSVIVTDAFTDAGLYIRFPNALMPNTAGPTGGYYTARSDRANQVFHPVASGVTSYNLKIFSKQGVLVFESNDLNLGWDGYYKGQLCSPGVYIWKVRGSYRNGEPIVMSGDVTLLNY